MKNLLTWIKCHKPLTIVVFILFFAAPLFFVHILYKIDVGVSWLTPEFSAGEVIAYIASFEAFIGTALLGILAWWQNERFKEENDKSQEYLQKLSEQQARTLNQILWAERVENIPLVDFTQSSDGERYVNVELFYLEPDVYSIRLFMTNITKYMCKGIHVKDIQLFTYGKKYIIGSDSEHKYNPDKGLPNSYNTHFAFRLCGCECSDKNKYFEDCCPGSISGESKQQTTQQWGADRHFVIEVSFLIHNVYDKEILETITCHFNRDYNNEDRFLLYNKEMEFEIMGEKDNA